jgi:hypothetical protein|tara:strand:- start:216 stop:569 length:354 start_codon:yes stop_codon:yes gene_type:complete
MPSKKVILNFAPLEPRCMPAKGSIEKRMSPAITNRGELIPCCWIDQHSALAHPTIKKMLKVSKISDHNTIEDILLTKEWQEFARNLAEKNLKKIVPVCFTHCKKRTGRDRQKIEDIT